MMATKGHGSCVAYTLSNVVFLRVSWAEEEGGPPWFVIVIVIGIISTQQVLDIKITIQDQVLCTE